MTSKDRREARYWRRKANRELNKKIRSMTYSSFNDSFGFDALVASYKKCSKTNKWKTSVKLFGSKLSVNCAIKSNELRNRTYKPSRFRSFTILERGHVRNVQSLHISDMVVQGSFRDNCLHSIVRPYLIYDNGACLSGKGTDFAIRRFTRHLKYHIDKYGTEGYIYFFDFKSYFKNIKRPILNDMMQTVLIDKTMYDWFITFTSNYTDEGLSLGSSISQICAIYYPNKLDHFVKDQLRIKGYGRYMDDGYIISNDKSELKRIIELFDKKCEDIGIILNKKKCHIVRIDDNYTFLKTRFFVTKSGKIVRRPNRKANTIERRKLRKFKSLIEESKISFQDALLYFHSWLCSRNLHTCHRSNLSMIRHFNDIFSDYGRYKPPSIKNRKTKVLIHLSRIA